MSNDTKTFMVEDAHIIFRNFSGKEGMYNRAGDRNFSVILDEATAEQMLKDGWNVKYPTKERDEGEPYEPYISVAVKFDKYPPRVVMLTSRARTNLDDDTVEVLDWANFAKVDLICRGSYWETNGKSGIKAYLKSMFVTIDEDYLELKYAVNEVE
jgi:hypothetical protein